MKFISLLFFLSLTLFARVSVEETAIIEKDSYPDKNTNQLKEIVLQKAKLAASKEIFGEFLSSETIIENGQIVDDVVRQRYGGVIHIEGTPQFTQTQNTMSVSIKAFASDKDLKDVLPHDIVIKNFTYSNPSLPIKDLKQAAHDAFIFEAIRTKKPSVRNAQEAKHLALNINIQRESFDMLTLSYHIDGTITYIPAFLNSYIPPSHTTDTLQDSTQNKQDFYGEWQGFLRDWKHPLLGTNENATDVNILITSFSEATIDYKALDCGGDLLVVEKTPTKLVFKEVFTYGKERCHANKKLTLKRVSPRSLELILENENQKPFHSKVYLSE
jgi:hypothetical protein